MTDKAIDLALELRGTTESLDCEFKNADRAKTRHTHASEACWCTMPCDGTALFIDSWSPPGIFCAGHYPYYERWCASASVTVLAVHGDEGRWYLAPAGWQLADGLPSSDGRDPEFLRGRSITAMRG